MLKRLLIAILVFIACFALAGLRLPAESTVERSILIQRPATTVFSLLDGFAHFEDWSPVLSWDPNARLGLSGPMRGPGARVNWQGSPRQVGTGYLEITASRSAEQIDMFLNLAAQGRGYLTASMEPDGAATMLTLSFRIDSREGKRFLHRITARYFGLLLDTWLGGDLERALLDFRQLAEAMPSEDFSDAEIDIVQMPAVELLLIRRNTGREPVEFAEALADAFSEISDFIREHELEMTGQPMAITRSLNDEELTFDAAIPMAGEIPPLTGRLRLGLSPSGRAVRLVHRGGYGEINESYAKLNAYAAVNGLTTGPVTWEQYVTDPLVTAPEVSVTLIFIQLQD